MGCLPMLGELVSFDLRLSDAVAYYAGFWSISAPLYDWKQVALYKEKNKNVLDYLMCGV